MKRVTDHAECTYNKREIQPSPQDNRTMPSNGSSRSLLHLLWVFVIGVMATACNPTDNSPVLLTEVTVSVTLPHEVDSISTNGITIKLKGSRQSYEAVTNEEGVARFTNIIPDMYDLSGAVAVNEELTLSGQLVKQNILANGTYTFALNPVTKQALLISKLYASGVKDSEARSYTGDVYIEFYNNSDQPVTLDNSYYFALVESVSSNPFATVRPDSVTVCRQVFRFMKEGTKIIAPHTSFLVVNSAVDHSLKAPASVDLSNAEFEAKDTNGKVPNNNTTPALELMHTAFATISNMNMVKNSLNSVILFKTTANVSAYHTQQIPGSTNSQYFMFVPNSVILDGVEILQFSASGIDVAKKRLSVKTDMGYKTITNTSGLDGQTIIRKAVVTGDVAQLIDTNNSSKDFFVSFINTPRTYNSAPIQ